MRFDFALRKADYMIDTVHRMSVGKPFKAPPHKFGMREGDDTVSSYTWTYVETFQLVGQTKQQARKSLGYIVGLMYTQAGMSLEPQDRIGRGGYAQLLDGRYPQSSSPPGFTRSQLMPNCGVREPYVSSPDTQATFIKG